MTATEDDLIAAAVGNEADGIEDLGILPETWAALDTETRRMIRYGCIGKTKWTQRGAKNSAAAMTREGLGGQEEGPLRAYRCPFTMDDRHHWHVGHAPTMETAGGIARAIRDLHGNRPDQLRSTPVGKTTRKKGPR